MPADPFLSQAPVSGYLRMHYFKKNQPFKELMHTSWQQNIYNKDDLFAIAEFVEAELRQDAMEFTLIELVAMVII